jgi:hypothetical protein
VTNRSGTIEPFRRKIIQYTGYADSYDEQGELYMHTSYDIIYAID